MELPTNRKSLASYITHGEVTTIDGVTSGSVALMDAYRRGTKSADTTFIDNAMSIIRKRNRPYLVSGKAPRTIINNVKLDDVRVSTDLVVHAADFPDYAIRNLSWLLAFIKGFSAYVDEKSGSHKRIIVTNTLRLQGNGSGTNKSVHMHGLAIDFRIEGVNMTTALTWLRTFVVGVGLGGYIGRYAKTSLSSGQYFLHYDPLGGGGEHLKISSNVTVY